MRFFDPAYKAVQREIDHALHYRFWDKPREQSNRFGNLADRGDAAPLCPTRHDKLAYSGPPHDKVMRIICMRCTSYASADEIRERGYHFDGPELNCPELVLCDIMDRKLRKKAAGAFSFFVTR